MRRRSSAGGEPAKAQRRKTGGRKRRIAPKGVRRRGSSAAGEETAVARLTRERDESLEQQAATAEVLKALSRSTFDLQSVLKSLLAKAVRLCGAEMGLIYRQDGDIYRVAASFGHSDEFLGKMKQSPIHQDRSSATGRAVLERRVVHIPDTLADADYRWGVNIRSEKEMHRTILAVPMLKGDAIVGVIVIWRTQVQPFTDKQIVVLSNFADQAVVAIENARLVSELHETLQQQTATADVLKVISRSTFDLQAVLNTLVESAARLCEADVVVAHRLKGSISESAASYGITAELHEQLKLVKFQPGRGTVAGRVLLEGKVIHVHDVRSDPEYNMTPLVEMAGLRTVLGVPLLREGTPIGMFFAMRRTVRPFSEKQIELLSTFADQAVIATENVRLFEAEQHRTRELSELLEQQTATSEVLQVISSSAGDLQPVFATMLEKAVAICEARFGDIYRWDGDALRLVANHNTPPAFAEERKRAQYVRPVPGPPGTSLIGTMLATKSVVHVADLAAERAYIERSNPTYAAAVELGGVRTILLVPMLKENELVGAFILCRQEVRPFTDKQIALVTNFAAQAVIAIENARLLNELRQRTDDLSQRTVDLTEALEQQTATSEVLKVISSSPADLQPVFDTMLANATRLCEATHGHVWTFDGVQMHAVAVRGDAPFVKWLRDHNPVRPIPGSAAERIVRGERFVHVADRREEPAYRDNQTFRELVDTSGIRASLSVALRKGETLLGMINVYRQDVRPFTDNQIKLVEDFAAQAIIAIENTRLLSELRESLQQQTATADVLKVISRSTFDLQSVLDTLVELAARLCTADMGMIFQQDGDFYRLAANLGFSPEAKQYAAEHPIRLDRSTVTGRVALESKAIHVPDVLADPQYDHQRAFGFRTCLGVPLLREGMTVGVFVLTRDKVNPFTDKQIELVTTFADQAVIAIENVRLFEAEQKRSRELSESLEQQTATSEVLSVISSSPGDLQPVFEAMLENAVRICDAKFGNIYRWDGEGLHLLASHKTPPALVEARRHSPLCPGTNEPIGRMITTKTVIHTFDAMAEQAYTDEHDPGRQLAAAVELGGARTTLAIPMLRENELIGSFTVYRQEVRPFTEKQIKLVATFADQAVIAIENTRC